MIRKHAALSVLVLALVALVGCRSAHVTSAILYIDEQMYQRAVDVLHEGLEYSPDEPEAYFYLGESHSHLAEEAVNDNDFLAAKRNLEEASGYYRQAVEMGPALKERVDESLLYNYRNRNNKALDHLRIGQGADDDEQRDRYFESAEGEFRLAYAAYPDSTSPIKNIARMKLYQAEVGNLNVEQRERLLGESLTLLDKVLESRPDAYSLRADKADVLNKLGRNAEAGAIYDELILEHPEDTDLLASIGALAAEERNFERAADLYSQVADIFEADAEDPERIYPLVLQAAMYYGGRDVLNYPRALDEFERALSLEDQLDGPQSATLAQKQKLHYDYGQSLKSDGEALSDEARTQFQSSINTGVALTSLDTENALGFFYMGMAHIELGNRTEADENLQMYERLNESGLQ